MSYKVTAHRKLADGSYILEVEDGRSFHWPPAPVGVKPTTYEARQLEEAKLLLEEEDAALKGKKLKSEGQTL